MLTSIGQYVGGKVITAILVVGSAGAVIWFWRHPEHLQTIWATIQYVLAWMGFVIILPWATFFVTPWVASKDSNVAAALMLIGYAIPDIVVALYLAGGVHGHNGLSWTVLIVGFLAAAVYNLKVCEFQAERLEDR
ncbi:MAG: hypothetical protein HY287_00440 [Planctomycetes bacterium]|nr:hypothetical protein [Planctomycetota bacterium]MBI3832781.1 hypothetical protein [Planctomycetota bacterium]